MRQQRRDDRANGPEEHRQHEHRLAAEPARCTCTNDLEWKKQGISAAARSTRYTRRSEEGSSLYLTGEVSESEGGQDPSLPVEVPFELVGHQDDGNGHDDPVRGVDEVSGGAERDDPRRARQHPESGHPSTFLQPRELFSAPRLILRGSLRVDRRTRRPPHRRFAADRLRVLLVRTSRFPPGVSLLR